MFMSMGWDDVSELRPLTGLLFIPTISGGWLGKGGMILTGENRIARRKTSRIATLPTNPTWTDLGANRGHRCERPVTNRLSHGTAFVHTTQCYQKYTRAAGWKPLASLLPWVTLYLQHSTCHLRYTNTVCSSGTGAFSGIIEVFCMRYSVLTTLMTEAVRISETSGHVNVTTRRYIPDFEVICILLLLAFFQRSRVAQSV
jgi:hypothetical protein